MAFVIPSQTLFQERTPPELMGRVVSSRFALVFGGMSVAMALGGRTIGVVGVGTVVFAAGCCRYAAVWRAPRSRRSATPEPGRVRAPRRTRGGGRGGTGGWRRAAIGTLSAT